MSVLKDVGVRVPGYLVVGASVVNHGREVVECTTACVDAAAHLGAKTGLFGSAPGCAELDEQLRVVLKRFCPSPRRGSPPTP